MAKVMHPVASSDSPRRLAIKDGHKPGSPVGLFMTIAFATAVGVFRYHPHGIALPDLSGGYCTQESHPHVNFAFIARQEGGLQRKGYVPHETDANGVPHVIGDSGVTVAVGYDLGHRSRKDLHTLLLPAHLLHKLTPYAGLTGQKALHYLKHHPLVLTKHEAQTIDNVVRHRILNALRYEYNEEVDRYNENHPDMVKLHFDYLPTKVQTALYDLAYQYGTSLQRSTPIVWREYVAQDYSAVRHELKHFGDGYSRRLLEAKLIESEEPSCGRT
jgi:hypothetical protein